MLKVYIGSKPGGLGKPDAWFDVNFNKEHMMDQYVKDLVHDVDGGEVVYPNVVISPVFGGMDVTKLSTGIKNTILAKYHPELVINWLYMGENCLPYLMVMAMEKDIEVSASCYYDPYTWGYKGSIEILNDGRIVYDGNEFFDAYCDFEEEN